MTTEWTVLTYKELVDAGICEPSEKEALAYVLATALQDMIDRPVKPIINAMPPRDFRGGYIPTCGCGQRYR